MKRDRLFGEVEVDETFIGGKNKPGKRGRGAAGKVIVAVAVERNIGKRGFGRIHLEVIPDASAPTLRDFIAGNIAPGSTVLTDALSSYNVIVEDGFTHEPINVKRSGLKAHEVLPGVHRVASLLKSWLKGTLQGGVSAEHLPAYLDEFTFRFNRRNSRQRGMLFFRLLEQAVQTDPLTYKNLVAVPVKKNVKPTPSGKRDWPGTLAVDPLNRPWRSA